jgi:Carboxypeptidase regulatory-like domain/TonB dependent receptor
MLNSGFLKPRRIPGVALSGFASRLMLLVGGLLVMCAMMMAQGTADIVGTVTDNSGAVVPNAKVTAKNLGTNDSRTEQTNAAGQFAFALLPIGDYSVTVEVKGFRTFSASRLTIATGDRARVDAALQVGDVTQTVEVSEQTVAVQTDSSTVGGLVTTRAVQDLPVNGRNFMRLVQLAPGATESVQSSLGSGTRPDDRRQTSTVSANGQTDSANNFLLDGMDNNERAIATIIVKPSIDAQQEVKVDTNLYPAETGRAGGAVINVITKSGTNKFHGTVFEFLRNDKFDAKDVFNVPQAGNPLAGVKPEFRQNQFGASIGGPIRKDKTFFFADYEGFRKIKGNTFLATIPSACELGRVACNGVQQLGNFSDQSAQIYDPVTHAPYINNVIPLSSINSVGANYAALYPTLNCGTPTCNFISSPVQKQYAHTADMRIDHRFGDKDNFYARYSINNTDTSSPGFLPAATVAGVTIPAPSPLNTNNFPGSAYQRQQSFAISHVHIFSPTFLLQLNAQLARYVTDSESANIGIAANTAFGGPANLNTSVPGTSGLGLMQFQNGGYAALGDGFALPTAYWDTNYQYSGTATWNKGSHTIKFGANLLRRDWSTFQVLFKGNFNINSAQTSSTGSGSGTGGNALASLLTGYYNSATRNMALAAPQYRDWEIGEFIQDSWRLSNKLTVNLGLRYDIYTPFTEKHNALSNFDPTDPATLASGKIQVAGQPGVSNSVNIGTQFQDFQPRVGFAWTVSRGTVVRGGFGTSFWPNNVASPANLKNAPMVATYTINQLGTPTFKISDTLPAPVPNSVCLVAACGANTTSPGYTPSGFSIGAGTQLPYKNSLIYMMNLTLEKEIAGNVVSVGFVSEPVRNLGRVIPNIATNLPPQGPGGCGATSTPTLGSPCLPFASTLPLVGTVQLLETNGVSNYTALQLVFQRRYSKGLSIASNYTFAKALSDVGGTGGACTGCGQVLNDLGRDYGPSDFMVKHRFTFTANYELPFGKNMKGIAAQAIKGWQVNAIYAYATGQPFTVLDGTAQQGSFGVTSDRPSVVAASSFNQTPTGEWFDYTQFRKQPFGTEGNLGHNTFTMPSNARVDLSIFKDFRVTEGIKLQFRAEGFNIANKPLYGLPNATIGGFDSNGVPTQAGNFAKITSTNAFYTPRDIQFALKLIF